MPNTGTNQLEPRAISHSLQRLHKISSILEKLNFLIQILVILITFSVCMHKSALLVLCSLGQFPSNCAVNDVICGKNYFLFLLLTLFLQ
jgi:hypothetical protein